ncbi:serine/threonine-protein kinase [Streptomyces sp. NBC_00564]|uniref:serine/threonine-protein kinase n=1 Tax=Streptomyces sp. NBC_00564 TaxID=2903663 RepID=UPI00352CA7E5|nr:serine/threonine protein kinase [Streptomyces sp. NBC_00564]
MGEVFAGRYELVDPIGRGGVGAVWRAWDHRRRRYVAAKVLQQSDAHALLRFVREQALRIDHPHVLAPASWAADDDKVLFTMDLVAGGSLVHLVADYGPLPPSFVCTLLDQLLAGLTAVHAEGVVHRDIKPANILLEATGRARPRLRLSDFGIAMRLGEPRLTETNYVVGTPGYFAPEQMLGADPDFPADLFAVGLVALYLLEGAKPDAKALIEYFASNGTPAAPRGIPEPLWQVVATLVQPDPQARFRTATGARKALASAAELLPEPSPDDELVDVFDQLGPLPEGFGPEGPLRATPGVRAAGVPPRPHSASTATQLGPGEDPSGVNPAAGLATGSGSGSEPWQRGSGTLSQGPVSGATWPGSVTEGVRPEFAGDDVQPGSVPSNVRPNPDPSAPPSAPAPHPSPDPVPPQPSAMSETGSFHLPPPHAAAPHTQPQHQGQPQPQQAWHETQQYRAPHQMPHQPEQPPTPPTSVALPAPTPLYAPPFEPTPTPTPTQVASPHQPVSPSAAMPQHAYASTGSYTARSPQVPHPVGAIAEHRARRARPRPGPPAKVAVPVLLLALACFAVGFWALTQI